MFFTLLVLVAALALESLGSYISVVGLSQNTSIIIIFLAVLLDFVKVIIATTLYKKWGSLHFVLKSFLLPALLGLMLVTSSGTYGYLIKEFGKTSVGQEEIALKIQGMQEEKDRIEARKKEIDSQIAALPSNSVTQRKRLTDLFGAELNQINSRMLELDKSIPEANLQNLQGKSTNGNLASIASTYGMQAEQVNKIVAFLITLMIDPLAIVLLTIANFLMEQYKKEKRENAIKILNGNMVDDDDSIMKQLKNKMLFLKSKVSKDELSVARFLSESKSQIIKKPLMNKSKEKLHILDFIYSTKLIENPKVIVPIKYQSIISQIISTTIFKESRPVVIKVAPEKKLNKINKTEFISSFKTIPPIYVIDPLKRIRREFLEEELLFDNESTYEEIHIEAQKEITTLNSTQFINKSELVTLPEPISCNNKEYIEENLFISSDSNQLKPVMKNMNIQESIPFIHNIQEVNYKKIANSSINHVNVDNFLNEVEDQVNDLEHEQESAPIHEFIRKPSLKVVQKDNTEKVINKPNIKSLPSSFKKPMINSQENNGPKMESYYSLHLDIPIEYTEPVIFHDEYEDFQIGDLGDLVLALWEKNPENEYTGFDIKEILKMEEINI